MVSNKVNRLCEETPKLLKETPKLKLVKEAPRLQLIKEAPRLQLIKETPKPKLLREAPKLHLLREVPKLQLLRKAPKLQLIKEDLKIQLLREAPNLQLRKAGSNLRLPKQDPKVELLKDDPKLGPMKGTRKLSCNEVYRNLPQIDGNTATEDSSSNDEHADKKTLQPAYSKPDEAGGNLADMSEIIKATSHLIDDPKSFYAIPGSKDEFMGAIGLRRKGYGPSNCDSQPFRTRQQKRVVVKQRIRRTRIKQFQESLRRQFILMQPQVVVRDLMHMAQFRKYFKHLVKEKAVKRPDAPHSHNSKTTAKVGPYTRSSKRLFNILSIL